MFSSNIFRRPITSCRFVFENCWVRISVKTLVILTRFPRYSSVPADKCRDLVTTVSFQILPIHPHPLTIRRYSLATDSVVKQPAKNNQISIWEYTVTGR
jgi:hypothetical protein